MELPNQEQTPTGTRFGEGCNDFLEECQLCHDVFDLQQIRMSFEGYFYCDKCLN